jgi:putative transposase
MSNYRGYSIAGGTYFFTLALANCQSTLLIEQIEALRTAYQRANALHPFTTIAIYIFPIIFMPYGNCRQMMPILHYVGA